MILNDLGGAIVSGNDGNVGWGHLNEVYGMSAHAHTHPIQNGNKNRRLKADVEIENISITPNMDSLILPTVDDLLVAEAMRRQAPIHTVFTPYEIKDDKKTVIDQRAPASVDNMLRIEISEEQNESQSVANNNKNENIQPNSSRLILTFKRGQEVIAKAETSLDDYTFDGKVSKAAGTFAVPIKKWLE